MTKVTYTHATAGELSLETSTLPESAISYLLQYGFSQSLQDSIAGRAKAVREELLKADPATSPGVIDAAIADDIQGALLKRLDAIEKGEVATRGSGTPRDPASGIVRELLVAYAKSKGMKLPKADSDEYAALATKMRAAKAEYITAELARRASAVEELDIDLG